MEIKDLLENLKSQKSNLTSLLNSVIRKQQALVQLNYENLESSIMAEEKSIVQVQQCEKSRIKILSELYLKYSITNSTLKLSEFIERAKGLIDKESSEKIFTAEKELKRLIKQILGVNQQNKYLVENSRAFIKETITSLLNANKSFLDRKV